MSLVHDGHTVWCTEGRMALRHRLLSIARDERGGELLEYALIAGLIVVTAIAAVGSVGTKVLARWNSVNGSM